MTGQKRHQISLVLLRLLLAAWIGAAVLYVITSVAEQTSLLFDSVSRDQLATIRFPLYYGFGLGIHVAGVVFAFVVWNTSTPENRRRFLVIFLLVLLSGLLITLDYSFVYLPLQQLITPPGQVRSQQFVQLHMMSRHANEVHLTVMLIAAILASLPLRVAEPPE
ncbi:MAG: hypothetical protein GY758_09390 [Fuerstiella sp.]|nr:hypothetical protein [Fuerstiella sp.]MCP4787745.1 hypothetical protein [Fuerstiella sp.]MCP4855568.1 hypothetical protein [Fuerstiella sp.]